uniref:Uncharacterized protein n=1 Tax=Ciona intestinalis TaxID=7719 RepID=H2XST2_CIOIN
MFEGRICKDNVTLLCNAKGLQDVWIMLWVGSLTTNVVCEIDR